MNIIIVDDFPEFRSNLNTLIKAYCTKNDINFNITEMDSGEEFLEKYSEKSCDIVFMDVFMTGISGIEAARKLYEKDKRVRIIFVTASRECAVLGYDVLAVGYLIKPISGSETARFEERLHTALDISVRQLAEHKRSISVTTNRVSVLIPIYSVMYINVVRRKVCFHLVDKLLPVAGTFAGYADLLLPDKRFFKCLQGIIVNLDYVENIADMDFILKNGEKVPISKREKLEARKIFLDYTINTVHTDEHFQSK